MRTSVFVAGLVLSGLLAGSAEARSAQAELKTVEGKTVGEAKLEETSEGVKIKVKFTGLPPGSRAFHIHEVGRCEPPFESAGAHFNPAGKQHGMNNPLGPHAGDLRNVQIKDGRATSIEVLARGVSLDGGTGSLFDTDGSALVLHAAADDYKTDPSGNAGDRLACGVIKK